MVISCLSVLLFGRKWWNCVLFSGLMCRWKCCCVFYMNLFSMVVCLSDVICVELFSCRCVLFGRCIYLVMNLIICIGMWKKFCSSVCSFLVLCVCCNS